MNRRHHLQAVEICQVTLFSFSGENEHELIAMYAGEHVEENRFVSSSTDLNYRFRKS